VIGQNDLSPVPDPDETNSNGDDPFVPMPPALDPPATVKEIEVAIKPSEHLSDVEDSEATSPLYASEPDSSETYVILGDFSETTEPLSGETQQLSITFEPACDATEAQDWTDLHRLLRTWRLGWLLFVVRPLAPLAKFPWCGSSILLFSLHRESNQLVRLFFVRCRRAWTGQLPRTRNTLQPWPLDYLPWRRSRAGSMPPSPL
ncbi:hypothetical protein Taro_001744, partial [Colocasia esculenta]|nr:hypothetical protein [Colocasia esculenta]